MSNEADAKLWRVAQAQALITAYQSGKLDEYLSKSPEEQKADIHQALSHLASERNVNRANRKDTD